MSNEEDKQNNQGVNSKEQNSDKSSKKKGKRTIFGLPRKAVTIAVIAIIIIVGGYYGVTEVLYYQNHIGTEDAQTNGHITPVLSRVSGYVVNVYVDDNEHVKQGQLLVQIDTTEFVLNVARAKTALQNARAMLGVAKANVQAAQVNLHKAQTDYHRIKNLYEGGAATKSKYQNVKTRLASAKVKVTKAKRHVSVVRNHIQAKKNNLKDAKLQLSYTTIRARSSGIVSKKNIREGQYITAGQPLMALADMDHVWVTANFKETSLHNIHVGQIVDITVDAYPEQDFKGRVQSISAATGASFSLLPESNATGNFVKVVQRVPVKIVFTKTAGPQYPLRLGLNVEVAINLNQELDSSSHHSQAGIKKQ